MNLFKKIKNVDNNLIEQHKDNPAVIELGKKMLVESLLKMSNKKREKTIKEFPPDIQEEINSLLEEKSRS